MQVSTAQFFTGSLNGILNQQNTLNTLSQQLSTGNALVNPADAPLAAAQNVALTGQIDRLSTYTQNGQNAQSSLQTESSTLTSVGTLMDQVRQLAQKMNNATVNGQDLSNAASTMQSYLQQLIQYGNTQNGQGQYMFAGSLTGTQPFLQAGDGSVSYQGDGGQNMLSIGSNLQTAISDPGNALFMSAMNGNGTFNITAASGNYVPPTSGTTADVGTVTANVGTVINPTQAQSLLVASGVSYQVTVSRTSSGMTYTVSSGVAVSSGGTTSFTASGAVASGTYSAGMSIGIPAASGGAAFISVALNGEPAQLDPNNGITQTQNTFTVAASQPQSLFQTVQNLVKAFQLGNGSPGVNTQRSQMIANALNDLDQGQTSVLGAQTSIGSRIQQVQALNSQNTTVQLQLQTQQSQLTNINYAQVITQYQQSLTALQAAESAFAQMQGLSLFKYL